MRQVFIIFGMFILGKRFNSSVVFGVDQVVMMGILNYQLSSRLFMFVFMEMFYIQDISCDCGIWFVWVVWMKIISGLV